MAFFRRAVLATALIGTGLAATTGAAFAGESHSEHGSDGTTVQNGLVNVSDVQTIVPVNACNNDIPVNVLGVQVPLQDVTANIPLLSASEDGNGGNSSSISKNCGSEVAAEN